MRGVRRGKPAERMIKDATRKPRVALDKKQTQRCVEKKPRGERTGRQLRWRLCQRGQAWCKRRHIGSGAGPPRMRLDADRAGFNNALDPGNTRKKPSGSLGNRLVVGVWKGLGMPAEAAALEWCKLNLVGDSGESSEDQNVDRNASGKDQAQVSNLHGSRPFRLAVAAAPAGVSSGTRRTAGTVLPTFFIPIGIGIFVTSNNIREIEIDYTGTEPSSPCNKCPRVTACVCTINFTLEKAFEGNVFMYYGLSNFYQNHRRYVKSRDDSQLNGDSSALLNPSKECEPYRRNEDLPVAPSGAIANSMFNDTLELLLVANDSDPTPTPILLKRKGIAWWTDKHVKFRNPPGGGSLEERFKGTTKPVNWLKPVYMLDSDEDNNGFINEDFIIWMRTAALPTFRKLYRLIQRTDDLHPTLPAGQYYLNITYNYPVHSFDGQKRMILSTISWMGGKNSFLGIAYITVGSISFFLGVVLLVINHKYRNSSNTANTMWHIMLFLKNSLCPLLLCYG
ncbi:LOW QUALITY PROTEIN: cell cycle control protein 50A-like [Erethizon dorsatum]